MESYNLPFTKNFWSKFKYAKYIPVCPSYENVSSGHSTENRQRDNSVYQEVPDCGTIETIA